MDPIALVLTVITLPILLAGAFGWWYMAMGFGEWCARRFNLGEIGEGLVAFVLFPFLILGLLRVFVELFGIGMLYAAGIIAALGLPALGYWAFRKEYI